VIDISHKECINCNLSRADKNYNNHCAFCFINLFPNDLKAIKAKKSKELKVVVHILNKYPNFMYNKPFHADLEGGCCSTKRRIDLRMLINNTLL